MFTLSIPSRLAGLAPLAESLRWDATSEALAALTRDYVYQAGYRLGVNGEWIPVGTRAAVPSR